MKSNVHANPCLDVTVTAAPAPGARVFAYLSRLLDAAFCWMERARSRRQLQSLDDRMLRDIGLNRYDAAIEANKPFWRP